MNIKRLLMDAGTAVMMAITMGGATVPGAWASTHYKTLYTFTGGETGSQPFSGLVMDRWGALYGTTYVGGAGSCLGQGCGVVFKLVRDEDGRQAGSTDEDSRWRANSKTNNGWTESVIYRFNGENGSNPQTASLIVDKHGNLYGTTEFGGIGNCNGNGCGVAFELSRKGTEPWTEKVLHWFDGNVGVNPVDNLTFDAAGNLYGTTSDWSGFFTGPGVVFKLMPNHDGSWTENILHTFDMKDGYNPSSGVIFDTAGHLYGTTIYGGDWNQGVVYRLSPNTDGSWTESVLHSFTGGEDGFRPQAGLIRDAAGNLFGVTAFGGAFGYGTVFELTPKPNGSWTHSVIYAFQEGNDGANSFASLTLDRTGTLYGVTHDGGTYHCGIVFKLTSTVTGIWNEEVVHTFDNQPGCEPFGALIVDGEGNLYGTTRGDGSTTFGSVFEITL
jgi:uncharacterized repeat protein (TIGR03803 family)